MQQINSEIIATQYVKVVKNWLKRGGVLTGKDLAYRVNQDPNGPLEDKNWFNTGDALVTTGFCVSVSQNLLNSVVFQTLLNYRGAQAKLISIDIKEQFYGVCKPSYSKNKWHTAIYVEDNGISLIVDPTCAQFGNDYVGKLVWDFKTWCDTFRAATDRHTLTKFDGTIISFENTYHRNVYDLNPTIHILNDCAALSDTERTEFARFLKEGIHVINRKILNGIMQPNDIRYLRLITNIAAKTFWTKKTDFEEVAVVEFDSKENQLAYIKKLVETKRLPSFLTSQYKTYQDSNMFGELQTIINSKDKYYIQFNFGNGFGLDMGEYYEHFQFNKLLFEGTQLIFDPQKDIYNSGNSQGVKTNVIIVNAQFY